MHVVAHSMGGLVARTFIKNHPERWKKMRGNEEGGNAPTPQIVDVDVSGMPEGER